MTTITSGYTGQYYQLPGQSGQTATTAISATPSLADALAAASNNPTADNAYLLDLSPQAQSYLNQSTATPLSDLFPSDSSSGDSSSGSFVLTAQQQQQIGAILAKYQDAPVNQDTYNQIQSDLQQAGLSPDQLAQQDSIKSFNGTQMFIDALNGQTDPVSTPGDAAEQTKSSNYMQQIYQQWQTIAKASASADASTTGVSPVSAS